MTILTIAVLIFFLSFSDFYDFVEILCNLYGHFSGILFSQFNVCVTHSLTHNVEEKKTAQKYVNSNENQPK